MTFRKVMLGLMAAFLFVSGWCPYLYAHHLWKRKIPNIPTTLDIDLGVLETGNQHFKTTVYEKLKSGGLALERLYAEEETPVEFIYKKKAVEIKIEFITSFETTDDTLNRFLGSELACNRIEAFELLLKQTLTVPIKIKTKTLSLRIPTPEMFLYHKGITFVMRSVDFKRDKEASFLNGPLGVYSYQ